MSKIIAALAVTLLVASTSAFAAAPAHHARAVHATTAHPVQHKHVVKHAARHNHQVKYHAKAHKRQHAA